MDSLKFLSDLSAQKILKKILSPDCNMFDFFSRISIRKAAIQAIHIYLRFTSDIASVLKAIVSYGLEHSNSEIVHESLISIPLLFPEVW